MYRRCENCGSTNIGLFHVPSKYGNGNTYYCARCDSTRIEESSRHLPEKILKRKIDPKNDPDSFSNTFMWRGNASKYLVLAFVLLAGVALVAMLGRASDLISLFFIFPMLLLFLLGIGLLTS
jgi:hypothetical protein